MRACVDYAMTNRHEDPKNVTKGDYPDDIEEIFSLVGDEMGELYDAVNYEAPARIIEEAGDCIVYLGMIIMRAREMQR